MAYEGELLDYCPAHMFVSTVAYAVVVSGQIVRPLGHAMMLNPFGHMLLNTGGRAGTFFHVTGWGQPRIMIGSQFDRYMKENEKLLQTVLPVRIPMPARAEIKLEEILSKRWYWLGVVNNCETMVEDIVLAGGGQKIRTGILPLPSDAANFCSSWP